MIINKEDQEHRAKVAARVYLDSTHGGEHPNLLVGEEAYHELINALRELGNHQIVVDGETLISLEPGVGLSVRTIGDRRRID